MNPPRRPITDSPWFWVYLFGTAALVALALVSPKYGPRQAQIEREFQGRQRTAQSTSGQEPSVAMSTAERTLITLRPLLFSLAAATAVAWLVVWRSHLAGGRFASDRSRGDTSQPIDAQASRT